MESKGFFYFYKSSTVFIVESFFYANNNMVYQTDFFFFCFLMIRTNFTIHTGSQSCEFSRDFGFGSSYIFFIPSTFSFGTSVSLT